MTEIEKHPWPQGGYAPGSYWCKCVSCEQQFTGDKRAYQCPDCVIQALTTELARLRQEAARIADDYHPERGQEALALSEMRDAIAALTQPTGGNND